MEQFNLIDINGCHQVIPNLEMPAHVEFQLALQRTYHRVEPSIDQICQPQKVLNLQKHFWEPFMPERNGIRVPHYLISD